MVYEYRTCYLLNVEFRNDESCWIGKPSKAVLCLEVTLTSKCIIMSISSGSTSSSVIVRVVLQ